MCGRFPRSAHRAAPEAPPPSPPPLAGTLGEPPRRVRAQSLPMLLCGSGPPMMDCRAHVGSDPVHPESRVRLLHCPSVREAMAAARSGGATRIAWLLVAVTAHFLAALNGVLARYLQASLRALLYDVCDGSSRRAVCAEGSPFPPSCRLWQSLPHLLPAWPPSPACCRWPRCCASMLRRCWPSRCGGTSCSAAQRAQQWQVKAAATAQIARQ